MILQLKADNQCTFLNTTKLSKRKCVCLPLKNLFCLASNLR